MRRIAAIFGGLNGLLLVPLALVSPTWFLLVPAHFAFSVLAAGTAIAEGLLGRPERARLWGALHLVITIAMVAAIELGWRVAGAPEWAPSAALRLPSWAVPWMLVLIWAWVPPLCAGLAGWFGEGVEARRSRAAVRRRKRAANG